MNKEEAKAKLRKAESDLRMVNTVLEMDKQWVKDIQEEIAKLEAIINKPEWQDALVQPEMERYFFLTSNVEKGLIAVSNSNSMVRINSKNGIDLSNHFYPISNTKLISIKNIH